MRENQRLWAAVAGVLLILLVLVLAPRAREELAPEPVRAWVAIQAAGAPEATVGRLEMAAGTPFTLHAVLEARTRGGRTIYYTEAEALVIAGARVPEKALRRWDRTPEARVLWFTVEGFRPYFEPRDSADFEATFHFRELFHADWGTGWSVPGLLQPSDARRTATVVAGGGPEFGTQRYHVRVELYERPGQIAPRRFASPGAADLPQDWESFPTVIASLPGLLEGPSRVFGLSQVEPPGGLEPDLAARLLTWFEHDLAFSRIVLLARLVSSAGEAWDSLRWQTAELETAAVRWGGDGVAAGDLLRAGDRIVVLYRDADGDGRLGYGDLCFDYLEGAWVRPLREVFLGGGLVERASLAGRSPTGGE